MRFIHTDDWHLGRILQDVSLLDDKRHALEQLIAENRTTQTGCRHFRRRYLRQAIPPESAIRLLEDFIHRVGSQLSVPIILISGNHHDSGTRLSFASSLLARANIHVVSAKRL